MAAKLHELSGLVNSVLSSQSLDLEHVRDLRNRSQCMLYFILCKTFDSPYIQAAMEVGGQTITFAIVEIMFLQLRNATEDI